MKMKCSMRNETQENNDVKQQLKKTESKNKNSQVTKQLCWKKLFEMLCLTVAVR